MLKAAAAPYFGMLERWLCEGALDDPFAEFMVQEDPVSAPLPDDFRPAIDVFT
jgi:gamma-tubulin complex component 2